MEETLDKPESMSYARNAIYAVYKGDEMVAMGTAQECAEKLGVRPDYIYWMTTPAGKRRLATRKNPDQATTADVIDWEGGDIDHDH
jgi:hypothetical protein